MISQPQQRVLVIAEAGVNHNGELARAFDLIDAAAAAGADFVKFQSFNADQLVATYAPKASYQRASGNTVDETQHTMLRRLELSREEHVALVTHCRERGIRFLSTGFGVDAVDMLVELGVELLKVPSGEITNLLYLEHVGSRMLPVVLSTGMASLEEIQAALHVLQQAGTPRARITLLHCTTEYPTPLEDVNLRAMVTLHDSFGVAVGYSDHTMGIEVPIAAVALGAAVIEKHFTMDRTLPGPDHKASLEPAELTAMVSAIRGIERALGDGVKRPSPGETENRLVARRSLVAARAIRAGEVFSGENIVAKRPGTGVSPMRWYEVVGRTAARDFAPDEMIEL